VKDARAPLLDLLRQGDARAFRFLVKEFQPRIYTFVFRTVGNPDVARDLTQDVFVSVARAIGSFRGDSQLSTWIYQIATNRVRNHLTRGKGRDHLDVQPLAERLPDASPDPEDVATGAELDRIVQAELARLPDDLRLLVVLRDVEGRSYEEIEAIAGIPLGTVKSRLHRARHELRLALERRWTTRTRP